MFDSRHKSDEIDGLRTERQIELFRKREAARRERAERREAEARVRHSNFELVMRIILLTLAVVVWLMAILGAPGDPVLRWLSLIGAGAWTAVVGTLIQILRTGSKRKADQEDEH